MNTDKLGTKAKSQVRYEGADTTLSKTLASRNGNSQIVGCSEKAHFSGGTVADVPSGARLERPVIDTYAADAYDAAIDQIKDWLTDTTGKYDDKFQPNDSNLGERIEQGLEEIASTSSDHLDATGENKFVSDKLQ